MCTAFRLNWYVLLCVLATFVTSSMGELTRTCYSDSVEKRGRHLCGSQLSRILSFVCKHGYHMQKRSAIPPSNNWEVEPVPARSPFMDKHIAMSVLHTRGKRGIVCECCKNPCSMKELKEYCKYPSKRSLLPATPPKSSQDQVTSNSIDDVSWGLDDTTQLGGDDDEMLAQPGETPSSWGELDSKRESHIGRLLRLLLEKSSVNDATN